jgi:uncharacterized lipoprotein
MNRMARTPRAQPFEGRTTMFKTTITAVAVGVAALGLSACDVQKTQEGKIQAPKYDVTKKQDGEVKLPKYDVTAPDVNVSKKEETVKVPKVVTEEKKIDVPTVDVKTGKEKKAEEQQAANKQ